jgi:hypothetical protein
MTYPLPHLFLELRILKNLRELAVPTGSESSIDSSQLTFEERWKNSQKDVADDPRSVARERSKNPPDRAGRAGWWEAQMPPRSPLRGSG